MERLLVLRPEPGASATVRRAGDLGLDAFAVPLFEIEPIEWSAPDPARFDGLLITSANALRNGGAGLAQLRGLPVYAVGEATADAAREAGFALAFAGDAGVDRLLASVDPGLTLLHLCGEDRREPDRPRQEIARVAVYRSRQIDAPDLAKAPGSIVLIHSPRAGRRFAELAPERSSIAIAAISPAAADAAGQGWKSIDIAEAPNDDALLALAASLCNNPHPK
jgi:uroporphyrinogen-III synthase